MRTRLMVLVAWSVLGASAALPAQEATHRNAIGMEFVLIKPGKFTLGRFEPPYAKPPDPNAPPPAARAGGGGRGGRASTPLSPDEYRRIEEAALASYRKGFEVTIPRAVYLGKYEVTQAQYREIMGTNPSVFQGSQVTDAADPHPVDSVTWADAQAFVKRLNERERTNVYRLPTEFEWEYAARAGAADDIPWNDIRAQAYNTGQTTQAVGKMQPNAWGLYDMLGNVWEWVQDIYNEEIFADPTPPRSGREHVLKGGGFLADVKNMTYMWHGAGPGNKFDVGFRVLREIR